MSESATENMCKKLELSKTQLEIVKQMEGLERKRQDRTLAQYPITDPKNSIEEFNRTTFNQFLDNVYLSRRIP